jgi:phenylpyruvate tautomerase PptA (4-oxalocrotonate tautomerase family)
VSIDAIEGRSLDAKRTLYQQIVGNLEPLGIPRDHVSILLRDIPPSNWGIRGGLPACEVALGFDVNV